MSLRLRLFLLAFVLLAVLLAWLVPLGPALAWLEGAARQAAVWAREQPVPAALGYVGLVAVGKLSPVPGGIALMLLGGLLFGTLLGGALAAVGAGGSALIVAVAGRRLFGDYAARRLGPKLEHIAEAMARDGFYYLLAMRLLPILPAWMVNLVPVAVPVPLAHVALATMLGILPVCLLVARVGAEVSALTRAHEAVTAGLLLDPGVLLPLLGLSALSLVPVAMRRLGRDG